MVPEKESVGSLMQKVMAWIIWQNGFQTADIECIDLLVEATTAHIQALGRCAKNLTECAGRSSANLLDMTRALAILDPSEAAVLEQAARAGKPLPLRARAYPREMEARLLPRLAPLRREAASGHAVVRFQPTWTDADGSQAPAIRRPAEVPSFMPRFPPPHTYEWTPAPENPHRSAGEIQRVRLQQQQDLQAELPQIAVQIPVVDSVEDDEEATAALEAEEQLGSDDEGERRGRSSNLFVAPPR